MAFKLKLNEGVPVLQDGKPVYINEETGAEMPFDANEAFNKIHKLGEESKTRRMEAEKLAESVKQFEGFDVETVKKNAEIAAKFKESEAIKNGEMDKLKAELAEISKRNEETLKNTYEQKLTQLSTEREKLADALNQNILSNHFLNSKFVKESLAVPPDMVMSTFGNKFKIDEHGKVFAVGEDGSPMLSEKKLTEVADFEEALELIVKKYPYRESILKASGVPGGGMQNGGRGGNLADEKILADTKISPEQRINLIRERRRQSGN